MKLLEELKKEIESQKQNLELLREAFDRANDSNNVQRVIELSQEIVKSVTQLETLEKFHQKLTE